jgi:predicted signal transduction protein with EAL and GGDEF domain
LKIAEGVRRAIEFGSADASRAGIGITVSLGVSESLHAEEDVGEICKRSDQAMYHAKESGRNRSAVYREGMGPKIPAKKSEEAGGSMDNRRVRIREVLEKRLSGHAANE